MIKTYIKRDHYLRRITPYIGKDIIKVLVGQRRVGKSYILYHIMDIIKQQDSDAMIIYINKEQHEFDYITDNRSLLEHINGYSPKKDKKMHIFIDEVQDIHQFEKALRSLNASGNYDIYCTGSNAMMLSSDLSTYLSGRYIEIPIHSLSYQEFLQFHSYQDSDDSLLAYIKYGGLPYLIHLTLDDDIAYDYIKNVENTILFNDVVKRFSIRNIAFLERLVEYMANNVGSIVSANKISTFLKSQHINISPNIVLNYLSHLSASFLIHQAKRQDINGKKIFEVNEKYYFEDLGLRHSIRRYQSMDINKVLENLVYNHLKIHGYHIHIGQLGSKEIDFVAKRHDEQIYIQVAYMITDDNHAREFGNLLHINDNYPKMVISMNNMLSTSTYQGISHIHIRDFLMSEL